MVIAEAATIYGVWKRKFDLDSKQILSPIETKFVTTEFYLYLTIYSCLFQISPEILNGPNMGQAGDIKLIPSSFAQFCDSFE